MVLELINKYEIETQEKLCQLLKESGYDVTQATISRDIKELQLVKTMSPSGKYKYVQHREEGPISNRFVKIFKETILSVDAAGNIIVIKTLSGCANAAAEAIDSLNVDHIVGSVAGDNTILVVIEDTKYIPELMAKFKEVFGELARHAEDAGVKLAIENCPMGGRWGNNTCNIGFNPKAWDMMFNEVPSPALGLEW
jgi:transcriptional regulator of arginine metabolism